jgi:hypothetical protein
MAGQNQHDKQWLIRTKRRQILGPVTKQRLIEFIEKGSLKGDDEITSGNGYWIWVREKDLVEKYVYGDVPQTFNPISEAVDVVTAKLSVGKTASIRRIPTSPKPEAAPALSQEEQILPDSDDLEFPEMDDVTQVNLSKDVFKQLGGATPAPKEAPVKPPKPAPVMSSREEDDEDVVLPSPEDLEFPDEIVATKPPVKVAPVIPESNTGLSLEAPKVAKQPTAPKAAPAKKPLPPTASKGKKAARIEDKPARSPRAKSSGPARNDSYLVYVLFLLIGIMVAVFVYYRSILNEPLPFAEPTSKIFEGLIPSANAQIPIGKKKVYFL